MKSEKIATTHRSPKARSAPRSFWHLMYQVPVVAGASHAFFMLLFFMLGAPLLGWANLGSVALFGLSYLCLRLKRNILAVGLILSEILVHAALAVRFIGWDSGFHYYLILVAPIVFVSRSRSGPKFVIVSFTLTCYLAMDWFMKTHGPLYALQEQTLSALRYVNVTVTFLVLSFLSGQYYRLVTHAERQLRALATTDPLTQLLNRRSWLEVAEYEVVQRQRHQEPLAVVLADIDHFKSINDQHGHQAGDRLLQAVSEVLRNAVRQQDSVARWGGEEFMILMPQATLDTARTVAERLREKVSALNMPIEDHAPLNVSMTFGVALHRASEAIEAPVRRADAALYQGKAKGRNRVAIEEAPA